MPKSFTFEGANYSFPDNTSDQEALDFMSKQHPAETKPEGKSGLAGIADRLSIVNALKGMTNPQDPISEISGLLSPFKSGANLVKQAVEGKPFKTSDVVNASTLGLGLMGGGSPRVGAIKEMGPTTAELAKESESNYRDLREVAKGRTMPDNTVPFTQAQKEIHGRAIGEESKPALNVLESLKGEGTSADRILGAIQDIRDSSAHPKAIEIATDALHDALEAAHPDLSVRLQEANGNYKAMKESQLVENATERARVSGDESPNYLSQVRSVMKQNINKRIPTLSPEVAQGLDDIATGKTGGYVSRKLAQKLGNGGVVPGWATGQIGKELGLPGWAGTALSLGVGNVGRTIANRSIKDALDKVGLAARQNSPLYQRLHNPQSPWSLPRVNKSR